MTESAAIQAVGLTKTYGRTAALTGLTMTVPRGQVFGFLGPNGAGKTTAVKLFLDLAQPSAGEVWVLGRPARQRLARQKVGYLPELFRYQGWLKAREVLALHCRLAGIERSRWPEEIEASLATVDLTSRGSDRVATFSKGMQQRLGLAVALLGNPELVLLDEPTSALDPVGRHDVRQIISDLRERGTAVFLNSHLLSEVEMVCDQVAIVDHGHVVASGSLEELLGQGEVLVRVAGLDGRADSELGRFGAVRREGDAFAVQGLAAEQVPQLVNRLVELGARVYAVEPRHRTLEDKFLELLSEEKPS